MIRSAIEKALSETENTGLLVGRFGTIEFDTMWYHSMTGTLKKDLLPVLERNAGVFGDAASISRWCSEYAAAVSSTDIMATGWYEPIKVREQEILKRVLFHGKQCVLRALEPYYWPVEERWTAVLNGQKVCVVSSFTDTISNQLKKGEDKIWSNSAIQGSIWPSKAAGLWPKAEWSFIKTGYAPSLALGRARWECDAESWETCVDYVVSEVLKTSARVIIIGCGGLGMVIAARLKREGKICIVMGGAIQVLFGIKGRRWENHQISGFWNSEWVGPSASEIPAGALEVERGCYWF
jgi:hypothetical protein